MPKVLLAALLVLAALPISAARAEEPDPYNPIVVAGQPISVVELIHWQRVAALSDGQRRGHLRLQDPNLRGQVVDLLISYRWLDLEAARLGISVTPAEVVASYRKQRAENFPHARDYRRFLRETGQTRADIRNRVRLDLISQRLQDRALQGVPENRQQDALTRYVRRWKARWTAQTACLPPYTTESCGMHR
jgi:foldase protein PrsA